MILQHPTLCGVCSTSHISSPFGQSQTNLILHRHLSLPRLRNTKSCTFKITSFGPGLFDRVAQLASNKVLIAAFASGIIGQLVKPFASVFLYGKKFDIKSVIETGGFPSSHSSATVASATLLGLERGFADPIFGLTVVYAGLIMYDAQGVRREVGIHAKTLNKLLLLQMQLNSIKRSKDRHCSLINSQPGASTPLNEKPLLSQGQEASSMEAPVRNAGLLVKSNRKPKQIDGELLSSSGFLAADAEELSRLVADDGIVPFKESVGHTEFEVLGGALLGFLVGLAVHNFL